MLETLGRVATRVYDEGVASERTLTAVHFIRASVPLREAVERGDAGAARTAAKALVASGHMTNLQVTAWRPGARRRRRRRARAAAQDADRRRASRIGSFLTSVWADGGLIAETNGIAEATTVLRAGGASGGARNVAGSFVLPPGELPAQGTLTREARSPTSTPPSRPRLPRGRRCACIC